MRIVNIDDIKYEEIIEILGNSGLVILPFDTCYGISCNPDDQKAVDKLLKYKKKREGKAISITVSDVGMAEKYVEINETAENIYDRFLPGPYTVISKSKGIVASGVEAENGTLGIRMPDNKWILDLVKSYQNPITSSSANQAYQKTPYKIQDILDNASKKSLSLVDLIVDAGELPYNPPSTVLDTTLGEVQVLRKGKFLPEGSKVNEFISNSEEETIQFGAEMYERFKSNLEFRPLVFALQGDLGTGKTQFTKGLARAMEISEVVLSPTFILEREYGSPHGNRLVHIDTWRLESEDEFRELMGESSIWSQESGKVGSVISGLLHHNVISIEWADKFAEYLRSPDINHKIVWVEVTADASDTNKRIVRWSE